MPNGYLLSTPQVFQPANPWIELTRTVDSVDPDGATLSPAIVMGSMLRLGAASQAPGDTLTVRLIMRGSTSQPMGVIGPIVWTSGPSADWNGLYLGAAGEDDFWPICGKALAIKVDAIRGKWTIWGAMW